MQKGRRGLVSLPFALCKLRSFHSRPKPLPALVSAPAFHHGGRQENQEGAGVHQQQAGPGHEVREVYSRLHHHSEVAARREGQARHHRQQLPALEEV